MKKILISFIIVIGMVLFSGCDLLDLVDDDNLNTDISDLSNLEATDIFRQGALEHIFIGEINKRGDAVGFHYEDFPGTKGEVILGTESSPDRHGVYEAEVMVDGVEKQSNRGQSTFFPEDMTAQEVVDAINDAYVNRTFLQGNTYEGLSETGIVIHMYLDQNEKIISAFPVK